jgi:hypothetical protein
VTYFQDNNVTLGKLKALSEVLSCSEGSISFFDAHSAPGVHRKRSGLDEDEFQEFFMTRLNKRFASDFENSQIEEVLYIPTKTYRNRREGKSLE